MEKPTRCTCHAASALLPSAHQRRVQTISANNEIGRPGGRPAAGKCRGPGEAPGRRHEAGGAGRRASRWSLRRSANRLGVQWDRTGRRARGTAVSRVRVSPRHVASCASTRRSDRHRPVGPGRDADRYRVGVVAGTGQRAGSGGRVPGWFRRARVCPGPSGQGVQVRRNHRRAARSIRVHHRDIHHRDIQHRQIHNVNPVGTSRARPTSRPGGR